jgi:hypothetical protein
MNDAQLELSLHSQRANPSPRPARRRPAPDARWWFRRMRQIVDRALDWEPAPSPRPEQIWFPGAHRQIRVNA